MKICFFATRKSRCLAVAHFAKGQTFPFFHSNSGLFLRSSALLAVLAIASFALVACGPPKHGPVFVQSASLASAFSETSVAVVPLDANDATKRNYVIGFNQNLPHRSGRPAWSVSTDQGQTWQPHLEIDNGGWGDPPEATLHFGSHFDWFVDPTVVSTGNPGQVAFFTLGFDDLGEQVAVVLSTDGGKTFGQPHLVSARETGNDADEPVAALNRNTGDIWVWWTQNAGPSHFLRRVSFDAAGGFHADPPIVLTDKISGPVINANIMAARLRGKDVIALAYVDKPDLLGPCPAQGFPTLKFNYHLAESTDGGHTWGTQIVASDAQWPLCVTDSNLIDGANRDNRSRPAVATDPLLGAMLMAITLSDPLGSRVHLFSTIDVSLQAVELTSFPPACGRARCDQFGPALAVVNDPRGRTIVGLTWHDTQDDPNSANHLVDIQGATSPNDGLLWSTGLVSPPTFVPEQVPWEMGNNTLFGWGDYEGIAGDDVSQTFIPAWSDNRKGGNSTEVWAARLMPFE